MLKTQSHITTTVPMRLEHFHDFYFLQALKTALSAELTVSPDKAFSKPVEKLQDDIDQAIDNIYPKIALRTFVYLYAACLGEARHARENSARDVFIPQTLKMHRSELYLQIYQYRPTPQNIQILIDVFRQDWHSGFGGKAWCNIAEALKLYFSDTAATFIDHVIDLEHNGGTAFNKDDAIPTLMFQTSYPTRLKSFLDYKFRCDILRDEPNFVNWLAVTFKVHSLLERFANLFGKTPVKWVRPTLDTLDDYLVQWEDDTLTLEYKWKEWVDVSQANRPTAHYLFQISGIDDIFPSTLTAKQILEKVKELKKKLYATTPDISATIKRQFNAKVKRWWAWASKDCKIEKKAVTYEILPVRVKKLEHALLELHVLVPYDGEGVKTESGFIVEVPLYTSHILSGQTVDGHIQAEGGHMGLFVNHEVNYFINKQLEAFID